MAHPEPRGAPSTHWFTDQEGETLAMLANLFIGANGHDPEQVMLELSAANPQVPRHDLEVGTVLHVPLWMQFPATVVEPPVEEPEPEPAREPMTDDEWMAATMTFGAPVQGKDFVVPHHHRSSNISRKEPPRPFNLANTISKKSGTSVLSKWKEVNANGYVPVGVDGPGVVWSIPLCYGLDHNSQDVNGNNVATVLGVADVADGTHTPAFVAQIAEMLQVGDGIVRRIYRLGHEHTGGWYTYSSFIDLTLIDNEELANYLNDDLTVQAIVRQIAVDGDRGPLFCAAWDEFAGVIREMDPIGLLDWNGTHASAEPHDAGQGNIKPFWNPAAMQMVHKPDIIGMDVYNRAANKSTDAIADAIRQACEWAIRFGIPAVSFPEWAICRQLTGKPGSHGVTDRQGADWLREFARQVRNIPVDYGLTVAYSTYFNRGDDDEDNDFRYGPDPDLDVELIEAFAEVFPRSYFEALEAS